jgi:hypothetical protein
LAISDRKTFAIDLRPVGSNRAAVPHPRSREGSTLLLLAIIGRINLIAGVANKHLPHTRQLAIFDMKPVG